MRNLLNSLNLPCLLEDRTGRSLSTLEEWKSRRKELKELLQREEYGYFPPPVPFEVSRKEIRKGEFSGFTTWERLNFHVSNAIKCVNIPVNLLYPENTAGQLPFILFINFRSDIPDRYLYVEDIIEKGFGVATFCYSDVSSDSADWDGLCDFFCAEKQKTQTTFGKIGIWSYMALRVMDYWILLTRKILQLWDIPV